MRSRCCCACCGELSTAAVLRSVEGTAVPTFNRTMRGLLDCDEAGDAVRSLRRLAPCGIGLLRLTALTVSCSGPPFWLSYFCEGGDLPKIDASSPSKALASALNFIGATGASSSELSPMENFHAWGRADTAAPAFWDKGTLRFRFGLEGWVLRFCRDLWCLGGSR